MKKTLSALLISLAFYNLILGQSSSTAKPFGFSTDNGTPHYTFSGYTPKMMEGLESETADKPHPYRAGRVISTRLNLKSSTVQNVNGGKLYQTWVKTENSKGLCVFFRDVKLPEGAYILIYKPDGSETDGPFTAKDFESFNQKMSEIITGENAIVEYFEPDNAAFEGSFTIDRVGYIYRSAPLPDPFFRKDFGQAGTCEINVNCSEGSDWQNQKSSVVRLKCFDGTFISWCTGTVMNNTRMDFKPYVLSAMHCALDPDENIISDSLFNLWEFYFNYEAGGCANPSSEGMLANKRMTGAQLRANSNDKGGETGSDFILMELNSKIPVSYKTYYAGWDASGNASTTGVCIHHPEGDIKKISTYAITVTDYRPYTTSPQFPLPATHWKVFWASTSNGKGITEGGSSGSPLFNSNKRVMGTLTGGNSSCSNQSSPDWYGKLSYHWTLNGLTAQNRLKNWLDPDNSGITSFDGVLSGINQPTVTYPLEMYPNPAENSIFFKNNFDETTAVLMVITDATGRELINAAVNGNIEANIATLKSGIYFARLSANGVAYTGKFIKE